jgi:hypothetical protein
MQGRRITSQSLSIAAMLVSAYSVFGWMSAVGRISGWRGLPQYEPQIPGLENWATIWATLAIALPFIAALLLSFGRRASSVQPPLDSPTSLMYPTESVAEKWFTPIVRYLGQLAISLLGTFGFVVGLFLLALLLHKLGFRTG